MRYIIPVLVIVLIVGIALSAASTDFHLIYKKELPGYYTSIAFGTNDQILLTSILNGNPSIVFLDPKSNSTTNKSLEIDVFDIDFDGAFYMLTEEYPNYHVICMDENLHITKNISIVPPQNFSYWWIDGISVVNSEIFVLVHVFTENTSASQIWRIQENSSDIIVEIDEPWSEETYDLVFWENMWLLLDCNGTLRSTTGEIILDAKNFVDNVYFLKVDTDGKKIAFLGFEANNENSIVLVFEAPEEALDTSTMAGSAVAAASGIVAITAISAMAGSISTVSQSAAGASAAASTSSTGLTGFQMSMISSRKSFPLKLLLSLSMRLSKIFRSKRLGRVSLARVFGGAFGWSALVSLVFTIPYAQDYILLLYSVVASSGLIYSIIGLPLGIILLKFNLVTSKLRKLITFASIGLAINGIISSSYTLINILTLTFAIMAIVLIVLAGIVLVGVLLLGVSEK